MGWRLISLALFFYARGFSLRSMIRTNLGALALLAAIPLAMPAVAQSQQEQIDARYDRALAAGYKALFLCSAIANAEANGGTRTPESVHEWELTGIYPKLDPIIRDLSYEIVRRPSGQIAHVQVEWVEDMPDRVAAYYGSDTGCSILPLGAPESASNPNMPLGPIPTSVEGPNVIKLIGRKAEIEPAVKASGQMGAAIDSAFDVTFGDASRTTATLVMANGEILGERYVDGFEPHTPQRTWSVAKSIAATLVGAAVMSREHSLDDPINLNYWRSGGAADQRNSITINHALRMATGRYSDTPGNRTDPLYWGGSTVNETALHWPLVHKPGTVFRYANNDTLLAIKAIEPWLQYYPPSEFFAKLGMDDTIAETDWRGGYVLSSQVWSTARDLAKLGQLYLNDGMWAGERLLPENWREYVSTPSGPQPEGTAWGYGAGWWTFKRPEGNAFEGIPDDAFAARGNRGQYLVIVPSRNVVIVRRGEDMVGTRFDIAAFTRDVLAALD